MHLICHLTSHDHLRGIRIYGLELFVLCQYTDKSCDHKHCDGGDIMFLIVT